MTASDEAELRRDLAGAYRLLALFGMDDLIYTHVSARLPTRPDHFLINPYGLFFHEITASSLVEIDHDGNKVAPSAHEVNRAGFVIHSAIHAARPDVQCVIHTHSRAGLAVSALEEGLLPLNQIALQFHDRLGRHGYEGIALDLDERPRLVCDLADKDGMILANHGLLTVGSSVPLAFNRMYYLEQACRIQVDTLAMGRPIVLPAEAIRAHTARQYEEDFEIAGVREWPGLLRLLDQRSPGWRD